MAGIEARGQRMTEQEKAELAEMVADKVVERLKQQQK
jgi:phenylpyruvate tautomerase PptA (4-oxalocrotonate tautomerase family)